MDDLISRQAVLDYIHRILNQGTGKKKSFEFIQKYVEKLPSVNPQEPKDSEDKIIRRTLENFMRGLWEEIQVGELEYTTSEVYEMLEREIFTDNHVTIPSAEPKWIPVSERLPKAGEYVGDVERYYLVQNEYGDILVASYTHGEYWEQIFQLKPIGDEIVAWMPLPEPYEPQESE